MKYTDAIKVHCKNLHELSLRSELSRRQISNTAMQLAELMLKNEGGEDAGALYKKFRALSPYIESEDGANFCRMLARSDKITSSTGYGNAVPGSHGKVAIVRNEYNESAFSVFSHMINNAKSIYSPSFSAAFESVLDGKCEFCICPVESSQSGRLFGFYSMLDRYELKISAVCSLDAENESVKYALVGNSLPDRMPKSKTVYHEYSVISHNVEFPADIIKVLPIFGAHLIKVDSLPVAYDNVQQKYFFTLRLPPSELSALEIYLSSEYAQYTHIGSYHAIK